MELINDTELNDSRSGKVPVGAQIRTLFNKQRRTIVAECCEKVSQYEFQAVWAEEERNFLQEELLRQQQDFCEVHEQNFMRWRNYENSRVLLSVRLPNGSSSRTGTLLWNYLEINNEVNSMNDAKDFQDADSVHFGDSHVASPLGLFPKHPSFEGMLKPVFISTSWGGVKYQRHIRSMRNFFFTSTDFFFSSMSSGTEFSLEEYCWGSDSHVQRRKVEDQSKTQIWNASPDRQPKIQSSSVEETLPRIMGQTNNDCRFRIFILTSSPRQQLLLAGR